MSTTDSATFRLNVYDPGVLPAWVSSQPLWTWFQIANTALSSVPPNPVPPGITGPRSKIDAWNGAAIKRSGSVYLIGVAGGHGDYAGNEVNALTLNTTSPAWVQLRASSASNQMINHATHYLDLRAAPDHTYYSLNFIDSLNKFVSIGSVGMDWTGVLPEPPGGWPYTDAGGYWKVFNLDTNDWDAPDLFARQLTNGDRIACPCARHPVTEDFYYCRGGGVWQRWNRSSDTWTSLPGEVDSTWYAQICIDPNRSRMLQVGGYSAGPPRIRNLNAQIQSASFGGLGAGAITVSGYPGIVFDEVNDTYLVVFNSGGSIEVRRVTAGTLVVDNPVSGTKPAARPNGIHTACQWVPELRGIVIANSYTGNVWFMRTST